MNNEKNRQKRSTGNIADSTQPHARDSSYTYL